MGTLTNLSAQAIQGLPISTTFIKNGAATFDVKETALCPTRTLLALNDGITGYSGTGQANLAVV